MNNIYAPETTINQMYDYEGSTQPKRIIQPNIPKQPYFESFDEHKNQETTYKQTRNDKKQPSIFSSNPYLYEEILEWWKGEVQEILTDNFVAALINIKTGQNSIVDFYRSSIEKDWDMLHPGLEFIFYVTRKYDGSIVENIEFNTPYLWTKEDEDRAQKFLNDVIPPDLLEKFLTE